MAAGVRVEGLWGALAALSHFGALNSQTQLQAVRGRADWASTPPVLLASLPRDAVQEPRWS